MLPEVQLTLIGACCIIAGGFIYYLVKKDDNDKRKFLAHNATVYNTLRMVEGVTIEALNSPKLRIDRAVIGKTELNKQQMQEAYDNMNNEESDIEESVNATFVVTKLYHQGNKKMVTLTNETLEIDSSFVRNLFEDNEQLFRDSYAKNKQLNCGVVIERTAGGSIKKAILSKVNPTE